MNKKVIALPIRLRSCALLALVAATLLASLAGCVTEQPGNEKTSPAINPVNVTLTYCHIYNNTSYLTGIITNVGAQNLVDVSLYAEGYANNTTLERGNAGPETGVNSNILPGEASPFMIKMSPVALSATNTTHPTRTHVTSANLTSRTSTRNTTSNRSTNQTSAKQLKKCDLQYKIFPEYKLLNATPYALAIANNKTRFSNRTISVSGEVYNGGTEDVNSSFVAVAFYGNDGYVLGVFVGSTQGELTPKKTTPFQIDIPTGSFSISSKNVARTEVYAYKLTH
ncbi:MAG: FxLYD domain-containing protein [Euryarchaeota archaeon]